jgi:hypothetical protein
MQTHVTVWRNDSADHSHTRGVSEDAVSAHGSLLFFTFFESTCLTMHWPSVSPPANNCSAHCRRLDSVFIPSLVHSSRMSSSLPSYIALGCSRNGKFMPSAIARRSRMIGTTGSMRSTWHRLREQIARVYSQCKDDSDVLQYVVVSLQFVVSCVVFCLVSFLCFLFFFSVELFSLFSSVQSHARFNVACGAKRDPQ